MAPGARSPHRLCLYRAAAARTAPCSYTATGRRSPTSASDAATAAYLKNEVSDGIIAPAYSDEALAILKTKKGGKYNVVQLDPAYTPAPLEQKDVFGITFEQGHNDCKIDESLLQNIVTENKGLPESAKRDMLLALITLKYTQSNSVCYAKDAQAIGVGAGQQSRIHCTRLAGQKADNWYLRRHPKVLALSFVDGIRRPDRDNAIDVYLSDECDDVLADGAWQHIFKERPEALTGEEKRAWLAQQRGVTVGSDAFFPFGTMSSAQERRLLHRRAGRRLDPRRQRHRDGEQIQYHHGVYRYAPVPSLNKEERTNETHGHRRRRPRTRHH